MHAKLLVLASMQPRTSFLEKKFGAIRHEEEVACLRDAQADHQQSFTAAYGQDACIPKHHHRFHLPAAALKLGFLPHCETHESKHRCLKSGGLVDRQKGKLADHNQIQHQLVARFLEVTKQQLGSKDLPGGSCWNQRAQLRHNGAGICLTPLCCAAKKSNCWNKSSAWTSLSS